ncbi:MAG: helix-turn-helix domain-containing protein [Candidatus Eremiobacteraeota bacterium]|nr:helix-turn-helix domain-containing protein [Candidatus Eremiobacteraeota bacterium]
MVDLRGLPTWERPGIVELAFGRLSTSAELTIVTENEPRGLSVRLGERLGRDVTFEPRRVGNHEWHITVRRAPDNGPALSAETMLKRTAVFRHVPDSAIRSLTQAATMHSSRRGQIIVADNRRWPFLGLLFEGVAALASGASASRARIFYEIIPYETFGESEFFDDGLSFGRTIVITKTARYLRIPREKLADVASVHPELLLSLGRVCAQRGRFLADALTSQATQPILARIASVLIPYALPEQGLSPVVPSLPALTQAQIAASAGTVKEVAARAIAELESREMLKREHGHIRLLDRQRLLDLVRDLS